MPDSLNFILQNVEFPEEKLYLDETDVTRLKDMCKHYNIAVHRKLKPFYYRVKKLTECKDLK